MIQREIRLFKTAFRLGVLSLFFLVMLESCSSQSETESWYENAIKTASSQYQALAQQAIEKGDQPRTLTPSGDIKWVNAEDWTSGFFPGSLFYLYELTGDNQFLKSGLKMTDLLEGIQYNTYTHDLGFMIYCSYGNAYRLTGKDDYAELMITGAGSLSSRYDSVTACIKSWDWGSWQYPVIIDNMMNLEYLLWASDHSQNDVYRNIAVSHADKTLSNHFRDDYSSYHVISYDTLTGEVESKGTFQGYNDESAWSRGQGWALYGYTLMYRYTKDARYLKQAEGIANFILTHPSLPEDMIPYWDFDDPDIPNVTRDASAGALYASALLELSTYAASAEDYVQAAETILKSLSSPEYLSAVGENQGFIIKHCTGFEPQEIEVDVPLNYGDYYYLEALNRYKSIKGL